MPEDCLLPLSGPGRPAGGPEVPGAREEIEGNARDGAPRSGGPREKGRIRHALLEDGRLLGRTWSRFLLRELAPRDWRDWTYLGGLAASSSYLSDRKRRMRVGVLTSDLYEDTPWIDRVWPLGDATSLMGTAGLLYTTGLLADAPRVRETGLLLAESLVASGAATGALQFVFAEERPENGGALHLFRMGGHGASGHAASSLVFARVMDHQFFRISERDGSWKRAGKVMGKVGLYSVPTMTAWQRLRDDKHHAWNVVLGAGVALYVTDAVFRAHDGALGADRPAWAPEVRAVAGPDGGAGVGFAWSF